MDPKANIREQRAIARDIIAAWDNEQADGTLTPEQQAHVAQQASRLAELVQALDEWRQRGGFDPYAK